MLVVRGMLYGFRECLTHSPASPNSMSSRAGMGLQEVVDIYHTHFAQREQRQAAHWDAWHNPMGGDETLYIQLDCAGAAQAAVWQKGG